MLKTMQLPSNKVQNPNSGLVIPPRALPTPPVRSRVVNSVAAPHAQLFRATPVVRNVAQSKAPIDLAVAFSIFTNTDPSEFSQIIKEMCSDQNDLMEPNLKGYNTLHTAAMIGNTEFFRLLLSLPEALKRIDINVTNLKTNTNTLAYAMQGKHFDLALMLIHEFKADIHLRSRDAIFQTNDNTVSMLRLAFSSYFGSLFDGFSNAQKAALEQLCRYFLSAGLTFFETPDSHCPPAFQLGRERFEMDEMDEIYIKQYHLTKNEFFIIQNMWLLEKRSLNIFKLLCREAESLKYSNDTAKSILQTWNWYILNGRPNPEPKPTQSLTK